jgi:D-alanine-D-alanine ligase
MVLMHSDFVPPDSIEGVAADKIQEWKCEYDVISTLQRMKHDVLKIGVIDDLGAIRNALAQYKPQVTFNLLEEFHWVAVYDHHVASFLELMKQPYTGCNARGLMLAHDKVLSKQIMLYHRIATPRFSVAPRGKKLRIPKKLQYPLLVKSTTEDASFKLHQSSVVHSEAELRQQVARCHDEVATDALIEEFIEGRELYVGLIGNDRLQVLPIWELTFENLPQNAPNIATTKVKWDLKYQKKVGVQTAEAKDLPQTVMAAVQRTCKRVYRALSLSGYARIDLRMKPSGEFYVLEANPNANLAQDEDFAASAAAAGMSYEDLLTRIILMGLNYKHAWRE